MRRDDFPLKTSHVLLFDKEEYPDFFNDYLAKNKEESLGRLIRRLGFSFRRFTKSILSKVDLEAEQRAFASLVGTKPLDVGVMGPHKQKLRAITLAFELGAVGPSGHLPLRERLLTIERMSALEKRKRLVERVIAAWDAVSKDTIKKAWLKAGL
ncbi:hypothetical protein PInf_001153 [Phytophthora infestans]|nr:hypothetical protein PInf_001153 [Phytophthora infestans]